MYPPALFFGAVGTLLPSALYQFNINIKFVIIPQITCQIIMLINSVQVTTQGKYKTQNIRYNQYYNLTLLLQHCRKTRSSYKPEQVINTGLKFSSIPIVTKIIHIIISCAWDKKERSKSFHCRNITPDIQRGGGEYNIQNVCKYPKILK